MASRANLAGTNIMLVSAPVSARETLESLPEI